MKLTALIIVLLASPCFAEETKGIVVKLDKLTSTTPADWKSEKPANRLRSHQFRLPGFKDVKETFGDAEIYIFPDLTGTKDDNFARYMATFLPPEGKTIEDIAKTAEIMVGKAKVNILDMEGTWLFKSAPFDNKLKSEPRPNSRVIHVIFTTDDGNYLIRLSGPAKTVTAQAKPFYDWIKGFK